MNTPPEIFAVDPSSGMKILLWDLNPQFARLRFARVEEITLRSADGQEFKGGLYYPLGYVKGKKYPLVIQTHAWNKHRFWIDGPWTTAFAAQPLAARGMFVLQADESYEDFDTLQEINREVLRLEVAIDRLADLDFIDREHVGAIGFSRTGMFIP